MPRGHSDLFNSTASNNGKQWILDSDKLSNKIKSPEISYEDITDLLREANDAQFGIVSRLKEPNEWIRDATNATPLEGRMPHDAPVIEANNALLRCLSRLRPIDYAIGQKHGDNGTQLREEMRREFDKLSHEILAISQNSTYSDEKKREKILEKEKQFDTVLVANLHAADLAKGCDSKKDAQKLLFHYRNLSSVLSPARTMTTITYDKEAKVLHRETQYPVTKKTPEQKEEIAKLKQIDPSPSKKGKNSHTSHNHAAQEADSLFADKICSDDTALSAQARKTHMIGAKNAFIVKNELFVIEEDELPEPEDIDKMVAHEDDTFWLGRMGSPVFVGKGEDSETVQKHTHANLEQMRNAANERIPEGSVTLHITTLNTDSSDADQDKIVHHVSQESKAGAEQQIQWSYAPVNPEGTLHSVKVDDSLDVEASGPTPLQKATRFEKAAEIAMAAITKGKNIFSIIHCASGQDRTGGIVEKVKQKMMAKWYESKELDPKNIEKTSASGGNAAEITTHHIHGSPGMKKESTAKNILGSQTAFSREATKEMYLSSANTNKNNKVGNVDFLQTPNSSEVQSYNAHVEAFEASLANGDGKSKILCEEGKKVLEEVRKIAADGPENLDKRSLNDLIQVLSSPLIRNNLKQTSKN